MPCPKQRDSFSDLDIMSSLGRYGSMAENLLRRQGWTEGQGLGKRGQGVPEPIKASLKFDSAGVGHDPAKEFTNHWWDVAFNRAAMNIQVEEDEEEVSVMSCGSLKDALSLLYKRQGHVFRVASKSKVTRSGPRKSEANGRGKKRTVYIRSLSKARR